MPTFNATTKLDGVSAQTLFDWHARPGAFERLVPPWDDVRVIDKQGSIRDGDRLTLQVRRGPVPMEWVAHHSDYVEGAQFRDTQVKGPFAQWEHLHRFIPEDDGRSSTLSDEITYKLPVHPLSQWTVGGLFRSMFDTMFAFRHQRTQNDLKRHSGVDRAAMQRVAITGASGMVGSALSAFLTTGGHTVHPLVRRPSDNPDAIAWSPSQGTIDADALEGVDAVVHLAGANIGQRWTSEVREAIVDSRRDGTRVLCEALAKLDRKPKVLISASAIGYYGDRGDETLTEDSAPGGGFLADVCKMWEAETAPAREAGIRVVNLRIGVVMTAAGGALAKQLLPFKFGVGGPIGRGTFYQSWIALDDLIGAIHHAMFCDALKGPVNATAPNPVRQREFASTLGRVLRRPAFAPLPPPVLKLVFGEMAKEVLLSGAKVLPERLTDTGFEFYFPTLEESLRFTLGR